MGSQPQEEWERWVNEASKIQSDYVDASSYPSLSSSLSSSFAAPPQCHTDSCTCQILNSESDGAGRWISSADYTIQAPTGQTDERYQSDQCRPGQWVAAGTAANRLPPLLLHRLWFQALAQGEETIGFFTGLGLSGFWMTSLGNSTLVTFSIINMIYGL
jgi:hypothetical protein